MQELDARTPVAAFSVSVHRDIITIFLTLLLRQLGSLFSQSCGTAEVCPGQPLNLSQTCPFPGRESPLCRRHPATRSGATLIAISPDSVICWFCPQGFDTHGQVADADKPAFPGSYTPGLPASSLGSVCVLGSSLVRTVCPCCCFQLLGRPSSGAGSGAPTQGH